MIKREGQRRAGDLCRSFHRHARRAFSQSLAKVEQTHHGAGLIGRGAREEERGHAHLRRVIPPGEAHERGIDLDRQPQLARPSSGEESAPLRWREQQPIARRVFVRRVPFPRGDVERKLEQRWRHRERVVAPWSPLGRALREAETLLQQAERTYRW